MAAAAALSLLVLAAAQTVLLDRMAVTVGSEVITEGQVLEEIRIVAFLNREKPDFSPASRRLAAERLIDQTLIRREMRISQFPEPKVSEAEQMLNELKSKRFHNDTEFRVTLAQYGISERELLAHLRWELAAIRFTNHRFQPIQTAGQGSEQAAVVNQHMEAWLKQARAATRIRFFKEAFE
jgi:hypothetical protein